MKYDVLDNNGYVCTCENLKAAELVKKNALLGGCVWIEGGSGYSKNGAYKPVEPINIRPAETYRENSASVQLTKKPSRKISKAAEKAQPIIELDGFKLIEE